MIYLQREVSKPLQIQRNFVFILCVTIMYFCLQGYILYKINQPYSGVLISKTDSAAYTIAKIKSSGWAFHTDLKEGDIIYSINKEKPHLGILPEYQNQSLNASEIQIKKDDITQTYKGTQHFIDSRDKIISVYFPFLLAFICLGLSIFLYTKKPLNRETFFLITFLFMTSSSLLIAVESGKGDFIALIILSIVFQGTPMSLILLLNELFKKKQLYVISMRFLKIDISIGIFLLSFSILTMFIPFPVVNTDGLELIYLSINIIFCIYFLIRAYIKYHNTVHKPFLKLMLTIHSIAFFPFVTLYALPDAIFSTPILSADIGAMFLIALPIGYFYLVATKQIFDIDFVFDRLRYYAFLSLIPTLLIAIITSWSIYYKDNFLSRLLQSFIIIFPLNILFLILKERLDFTFRNHLFRTKTNLYVNIEQFTAQLSSIMKTEELEKKFTNEIVSMLKPSFIQFVQYNMKDNTYTQCNGYGQTKDFTLSKKKKWSMAALLINDLLEDDGCIGIYLYSTKHIKHYIWIGTKVNNIKYNTHEKSWFITVTTYVRLIYENLYTINEIIHSLEQESLESKTNSASLSRLLFQISEQERRRLASDLHDSALQDQIVWYRKLDSLLKNKSVPLELKNELKKIHFGMHDVIQQIRDTCNELRPSLLSDAGLIGALRELLAQTQLRVQFQIQFDHESIQEHHYDFDKILSLYRIIQELLTNADKHSEATIVSIFLWEENNCIFLDYRDNGKGFNIDTPYSPNQHMGLSGIKGRLQSIGGEIHIVSEAKKGLQINITVPRW
ncbi:sensor histidine kinase [Bacillus cereus]|uniref:sensor histidine kinase n=1 Tax=Bacillus cereus TaxID=1396 RepID=UPI0015969F99|nr:sensor histidine kinase [Bacillus cereus]